MRWAGERVRQGFSLSVNAEGEFPYDAPGHYVVIKGMTYVGGVYKAVLNDPNKDYSDIYSIPVSSIMTFNRAHSGCIIIFDEEKSKV